MKINNFVYRSSTGLKERRYVNLFGLRANEHIQRGFVRQRHRFVNPHFNKKQELLQQPIVFILSDKEVLYLSLYK